MKRIALILLVLLQSAAVSAAPLIADLARKDINVTVGFDGTDVLLFGAVDPDDPDTDVELVVTVSGPPQEVVLRKKERRFGVWLNTQSHVLTQVPSFFSYASSGPLDEILNPLFHQSLGIFLDSVRVPGENAAELREALIRRKKARELYQEREGDVKFLSNQLFRTDLHFPSEVPTGFYTVRSYLIQDGRITSIQETELRVKKTGFGAWLYDAAQDYAALYGIFAVLLALFMGYASWVAFSRR